jgi:hypothetical protein
MSLSDAADSSRTNSFHPSPAVVPAGVGRQKTVASSAPAVGAPQNESTAFIDRRGRTGSSGEGSNGRSERRQFGSSHQGLSEAGRELAVAIDQYKLQHRRRYITCDEMLLVITRLGYSK